MQVKSKSAFSDNVKSEVYEERLQNIGFLAHELNRTPTAIHCVFTTSTFYIVFTFLLVIVILFQFVLTKEVVMLLFSSYS
jgi:hypothetical protein